MKISKYKQYRQFTFKKTIGYLKSVGLTKINRTQPKLNFIKRTILNKQIHFFKEYNLKDDLFDFHFFQKVANYQNQTLNDFLNERKYHYYFCDFFETEDFYFGILFFEKEEKPTIEEEASDYIKLLEKFFYKDNVLSSSFIINKNNLNDVYLTKPQITSKFEYDEFFNLVQKIDFNKQKVINPYFLDKKSFEEIKDYLKQLNVNIEVKDLIERTYHKTKKELEKIPYSLTHQDNLEEYKQLTCVENIFKDYVENVLKEMLTSLTDLTTQKEQIENLILSKLNN